MITIEEDKQFLLAQQEKGRRGSMAGVDTVLARKEARAQKKKDLEEQHRQWSKEKEGEPSTAVLASSSSNTTFPEASEVEEMPGPSGYVPLPKRARQNIMSPGLASALDCTKMSDRKAAFVISETIKSLGVDIAD